jgi:3'-5' exonuclease
MAEKGHKIVPQVAKACGGDFRALLRLGENEGALEHALHEITDALGGPGSGLRVALFCGRKIASQFRHVLGQHALARRAQIGMGGIDFLHRRAEEAGVLRNRAAQHCDAQIDVAEEAIARISLHLVGRGAKQNRRRRAELLDRRNAELLLAVEVVKEAALGNARGFADVVDGGGRVAFGPNGVGGSREQLGAGFGAVVGSDHLKQYRLVGMFCHEIPRLSSRTLRGRPARGSIWLTSAAAMGRASKLVAQRLEGIDAVAEELPRAARNQGDQIVREWASHEEKVEAVGRVRRASSRVIWLISERACVWAHVLGAPHIGERSETKLTSDFVEKIGQLRPQLVTFNGHSFDLPVLRYRAMVNRLAAVGLQVRPYFYRYSEDALDLCDVLGSFVPGAKVRLDEVSKILGLLGKLEGVDGSRVEEMVLAEQIEEVARYCESDVLNTYRVWLVYELFRGSITAKEHEWSEAQVRDFVASRKSANPHLSKAVGVPEATTQNSSAVVSS